MANDVIRMQLQAELQMDKSIANINKQLKALSTQVDKLKISIDVDKNLAKSMTNINQSTSQATKSSVKFNETLKELIHLYKTQQISAQDFVRSASKYREVTEFTNLTQKEQIQLVTQLTKAEKEHTRVLNESHNIKKKIAKEEIASIKQQEDLVNKINLFKQRMLGSGVLKGEMDIFADKQKGKYDKTAFSLIKSDIESLSTQTPDVTNKLKELGVQWNSLRQTTMQSGSVMSRTFENMSKFLRFYLAGGILVGFVREMRNGVNSIKELDSSLVELSKVSDLTSTQLRLFTDRAYEAGKAIGRTGKEVIDATTEFKRAGYEINEAFELSQQALLLTNIGDGIKDVKEASSSLIAILKGFKMEVQDTGHIVDALNEVSNNYAVDTVNLTEIMKRASGTIAQTGTSYEELLGLATGGFESLRNAEMVASGINMISQRLRGMSEDGEAVEGLIPKIQSAFDKYTRGAVSIIDKQNGGLHSTYEILSQLQKVYPKLGDEAKAYINEAVAGNRQNKVLVAILENWENVEGAISSATDSLGSANAENEKYLQSIEGKSKRLASSVQLLWKNTISSDSIKYFIDLANAIVMVVDKVGLLNVALSGLWIYLSLSGKMSLVPVVDGLAIAFGKWAMSMGASSVASGMLATALSTLTPLLALGIVVGAVKLIDKLTISLKEQKEIVETLSSELQVLQSEYENLKSDSNRTEEQEIYLKLLEKEIEAKNELLKIEKERELQMEFFSSKEYRGGGYTYKEDTKIEKTLKDIEKLKELQKDLLNVDLLNVSDSDSYNKVKEQISELTLSLVNVFKTIEDGRDVLGSELSPELQNLSNAIADVLAQEDNTDKFSDSMSRSTKAIKDFYDKIIEGTDIFNDFEESQEKLKKITEDSIKSYEDLTSKIQSYYVILDELNSKEGLSAKSKQDIITKYQELLPYINNEKELRNQLITIIKKEETAQKQAYINMIMYSEDFYNAKLKGNKELVEKLGEYYNKDLENAKSLAEAKAKVEERLITNISKQWAKFYRVSAIAGEGYVQTMGAGGMIDEFGRNMAQVLAGEMRSISSLFDDIIVDFGLPSFKDINMSSIKDKKPAKDQYKAEADRYKQINLELDKNNVLLQRNKVLQDLAGDDLEKRLKLMNEEIELNKQRQASLHELNNERRKEMQELEKALSGKGFKFEGEGDNRIIANLDNIKGKTKEVEEQFKRYIDLQSSLLPQASQEWWNLKNTIENITTEMDKLVEQQRELARQDWIKKQNDLYEDQQKRLSALEQIQEKIVAIIRKRGEEEKKALDEAYRADIDALEKRHTERKKTYADDLDEFKKMIQAKIDALDEQHAEEDYLEQLNKEREEANRLQKEIDVLSLDDSLTARNKTIELRKQLADQNEKIAKRQQNRERDLLKRSLQDQLKNREQDAKDKEDIANKTYENDKKRLEEDYRINKEFLDKKYSDEQVYAEARESIMRGQVEVAEGVFMDIYDAFSDFEDKFGRGMGILGDIIKRDFLDQLSLAQDAIKEMDYLAENTRRKYDSDYQPTDDEMGYNNPRGDRGGSGGSSRGGGKLSDMSKSDYYKYIQMKQLWEMARASNDKASEDYAHKEAQALRDKYGIASDLYSYNQLKDIPYEQLKLKGYDRGGKIDYTGLAMVHGEDNPEWMLRDHQLQKIISDSVLSTIKVAIPKIPNVTAKQGVVLNIENFIKANNITKDSLPMLQKFENDAMSRLKNELNKFGVRPARV